MGRCGASCPMDRSTAGASHSTMASGTDSRSARARRCRKRHDVDRAETWCTAVDGEVLAREVRWCSPIGRGGRLKIGSVGVRIPPPAPTIESDGCRRRRIVNGRGTIRPTLSRIGRTISVVCSPGRATCAGSAGGSPIVGRSRSLSVTTSRASMRCSELPTRCTRSSERRRNIGPGPGGHWRIRSGTLWYGSCPRRAPSPSNSAPSSFAGTAS